MTEKMLKPKQIKCIELMVNENRTQKDIAKEINVAEKTISAWKKNEDFIKAYDDAIKSALRYASAKALKKQIRLIDSKNQQIAHLAAKDILDRGGYKSEDKVELEAKVVPKIIDDLGEE